MNSRTGPRAAASSPSGPTWFLEGIRRCISRRSGTRSNRSRSRRIQIRLRYIGFVEETRDAAVLIRDRDFAETVLQHQFGGAAKTVVQPQRHRGVHQVGGDGETLEAAIRAQGAQGDGRDD